MTSTTGRMAQSQKFGKHLVGVLGAAVAAAAAVTSGSAGIAHAYTVVNNTGSDVVAGRDGLRVGNGGTWNTDQSGGDFSLVGDSSTSWSLDWGVAGRPGFTSGSTTGSASFTPIPFDKFGLAMPTTEYLTLGGTTHSFYNSPCFGGPCGGGWSASGGNTVSFVRTNFAWGPPIRTRGAVIVVNEKPVKIWGPQTTPVRGVVPKGPAPQAPVAAVSPVSSTLPAQPQSVAKTATPHRAAARRAAVTASRSAPPA